MPFENGKRNLLRNAKWLPGPAGAPEFFTIRGPASFDQLQIKGCHTMSLTLLPTETVTIQYNPLIPMDQQRGIELGAEIRAVDPGYITYAAAFLDDSQNVTQIKPMDVTYKVEYYFDQIAGQFLAPSNARFVRLTFRFCGPATACSLWAPYAVYL